MATSQGAARRKEQCFLESRRERGPADPASSPPASRPWRNARLLSPATGRGGQLRQPREAKARSEGFRCLKVCKVFRIGARGNCHPLSLVAPQTTLRLDDLLQGLSELGNATTVAVRVHSSGRIQAKISSRKDAGHGPEGPGVRFSSAQRPQLCQRLRVAVREASPPGEAHPSPSAQGLSRGPVTCAGLTTRMAPAVDCVASLSRVARVPRYLGTLSLDRMFQGFQGQLLGSGDKGLNLP